MQAYGNRAKQKPSALTFHKLVPIRVIDIDHYQRIYVDDLDVSAEMVRMGAARVYRKYAKDKNLYKLEDEAKADKRGLWGLPEAQRVTPWEWRRG